MGRMPPLVCLWPGLPQLWLRGSWTGLALAVGFSGLVNFLLAATFVWTAWLSIGLLWAGWIAVLVVWVVSAWGAKPVPVVTIDSPPALAAPEPGGRDLLSEVYTQYLQGNWFEAETVLQEMLRLQPRDAEALLQLATLQRHTERLEEAADTLDRLERLDEAIRWQLEIAAERIHLARLQSELDSQDETDSPEELEQTDHHLHQIPEATKERIEAA